MVSHLMQGKEKFMVWTDRQKEKGGRKREQKGGREGGVKTGLFEAAHLLITVLLLLTLDSE